MRKEHERARERVKRGKYTTMEGHHKLARTYPTSHAVFAWNLPDSNVAPRTTSHPETRGQRRTERAMATLCLVDWPTLEGNYNSTSNYLHSTDRSLSTYTGMNLAWAAVMKCVTALISPLAPRWNPWRKRL